MEDEKYINEEEEMTIDWMGILRNLFKRWKFIFLVTFIFSVLGVVAALMAHRKYQVTVTLAPELQNRASSSLSSLASMLGGGMNLNSSPDALNISPHTVISHRKNIVHKTGIKSVAGLTVYAMLNNLITLE